MEERETTPEPSGTTGLEASRRKRKGSLGLRKERKRIHTWGVAGESSRGSWLREALRKEHGFKIPEKLEGLGVAEFVLAWVS